MYKYIIVYAQYLTYFFQQFYADNNNITNNLFGLSYEYNW